MSKIRLRIIETSLTALIGIITILTQPPLPLLAIPFVIIIPMRLIFSILEDSENHREKKQ